MNELVELHDELREVARSVLETHAGADDAAWATFAASGWLGLEVPEELGGAGATFAETAVILEELGRATSASAFLGTVVLGVGTLLELEATPARDELLAQVVAGEARTCLVADRAPDHDVPALRSLRLQRAADGLRLDGEASFVPDAVGAGPLLVLAAEDDGPPVVVAVPADAPGLEVRAEPQLDETRHLATVVADGAGVDEAQVWRFAGDPDAAMARLIDRAAVAVALDGLGLGEAMLATTVAYVGERQQFGRAVGSFQAVKHACADALVQLAVSRELVLAAVEALVERSPDAGRAASMATAYVGSTAVDVVGSALQLHGGIGYTWEGGVHRYLKRAVLDRALFGTPAAHRRALARRYDEARPVRR